MDVACSNAASTRARKRPAEDDNWGDQPLAKKFGRLHIDPLLHGNNGLSWHEAFHANPRRPNNDLMFLDDTKTTSYVYDLDREIQDIEAQEFTFALLPGVSESLTAVPRSVLSDPKPPNNELVLYREPSSLTVSQGNDNVRRAIVEYKARIRARQGQSRDLHENGIATEQPLSRSLEPQAEAESSRSQEAYDDADTMEID